MKALSGLDSAFLYLETPRTHMHVSSVSIYEPGRLDFLTFRQHLASRLHRVRTYRQRLVMVPLNLDHPYWIEDPDFDLDLHLHHVALPPPGGWQELRAQMGRILSRPLDRSRPLWEMTFVEGLNTVPGIPPGSVANMSKVHHAAIDGVSGSDMLAALLDPVPEPPRQVIESDPWRAEPVPGALPMLARTSMAILRRPLKIVDLIPAAVRSTLNLPGVAWVEGVESLPLPYGTPRTCLNVPVSGRRVWDGVVFDLRRIKAVKDGVSGTTVNDVVLSICAGALRRYLAEKDDLPRKPLIAMVPISTRTGSEHGTMGNQVSAMLVDLATDEPDPLGRLRRIHAGASRTKAYSKAIDARSLVESSELIPFALAGLAARLYTALRLAGQHNPIFNCIITNVPGPQIPLYLHGARLLANIGAGPIFDGVGLIITILSYAGMLAISATSAPEIMPDIDVFMRYMEEALAELEAALATRRSAGHTAVDQSH